MEKQKERDYDSVRALILGIHAPVKNVSRPSSPTEFGTDDVASNDKPSSISFIKDPQKSSLLLSPKRHSLQVHHFDHTLRIPTLLVSGPASPSHTLDNHLRRFSFGLRRHSHSHTVH